MVDGWNAFFFDDLDDLVSEKITKQSSVFSSHIEIPHGTHLENDLNFNLSCP